MKSQYGHDEQLRMWLKSIISLALIPTKNVQDQFVDLLEQSQGNFLSSLTIFLCYSAGGKFFKLFSAF